ncbi:peptidylprolyl isomerase [Thiococcus pfennigii]|uniref:peptidylprolyl isomerase n=1 Tax=Thiococcus pfennigii TaxID=1057 RepID=UPI0019031469|nr:peptidylprolyl isomerase [Thiococcus pfennigii]MBK1701714.1 molecular chaperone SurA [Thiococcus pfennigii]MBK1733280.1 molecular chaperone SurA [Thiococcus pfennigii]
MVMNRISLSGLPTGPMWARRGPLLLLWLVALLLPGLAVAATELDAIVAVVNDDVIVASELRKEIDLVVPQMEQRGTPVPPPDALERQVLDRLILKRLQLQRAEALGIQVDEAMLERALESIATRNGLTLDELRQALEAGGVNFEDFREDTRMQILTSQLQNQEVVKNIQVTDQEVDRFLEKESSRLIERTAVRLQHILIAVPEGADEAEVERARQRAQTLVARLRGGADFARVAAESSDGRQALEGGDLGWFEMAAVPSLVSELAFTMAEGEISDPLRSPSGFHIIRMAEIRGSGPQLVTQTQVRHILIRTNELVADADARRRLEQLRMRIVGGEDFATLARANSDDTGSALRGGDLGWLSPGDTVSEFETQMATLAAGEVSQPFRTAFGWHLVQVLERREQDTTDEVMRNKAREAIRQRKATEEIDLWLQRLRAEAYVDIRLDRLARE